MAKSRTRAKADKAESVGRKNLLINSEFKVNQRNATSITGSSGADSFLSDRWRTYTNGVNYSASIQEVTLPDGTITNSFKTTATSANNPAFFHPYQRIEAFGKEYLRGKTVTLSAWVRTNVAGQKIRVCDTQACASIGDVIPSDGQWHKVSASHTIAADMNTGATNYLQFHPIFNNVSISTNDYCEFALPQMELGSVATDFEHRSYGEELALCKRYYQDYTEDWLVRNIVPYSTANSYANGIIFPVIMRASPTITMVDSRYYNGGWRVPSNNHVARIIKKGFNWEPYANASHPFVQWRPCLGDVKYKADAEL